MFEILWSFHRLNRIRHTTEESVRASILLPEISRRTVRATREEEMSSFVGWVKREPVDNFSFHSGIYEGFWTFTHDNPNQQRLPTHIEEMYSDVYHI